MEGSAGWGSVEECAKWRVVKGWGESVSAITRNYIQYFLIYLLLYRLPLYMLYYLTFCTYCAFS